MAKTSSKAGAIVAGIAGLTAAAVGAYYLYGHQNAAKNRAKVKGWMLKAKGEVIEELEKGKEVTESAYMGAVDAVARKYRQLKSIDMAELEAFIFDMRDHWIGIKRTLETRGKKVTGSKAHAAQATAPAKKKKASAKKAR